MIFMPVGPERRGSKAIMAVWSVRSRGEQRMKSMLRRREVERWVKRWVAWVVPWGVRPGLGIRWTLGREESESAEEEVLERVRMWIMYLPESDSSVDSYWLD